MPNYKTHLVGGLLSFGMIFYLSTQYVPSLHLSAVWLAAAFLISMIGSIFPDIDVPSKMQKLFFISSVGGILASLLTQHYQMFVILSISILFVAFLTHRTITHKPIFLILFSLIPTLYACYNVPEQSKIAFALYLYFTSGCMSHILFDRTLTNLKKLLGQKRRY